jgi:hypothetical protein
MSSQGRKHVTRLLIAIGFAFTTCLTARISAQQAGGVTPGGSQVRLVRSVVGAKGEERNGSYVM